MKPKQNICVFCGSLSGNLPIYYDYAKQLGKHMAEENLGLVYGGGKVGLMGVIAQSVLDHNGYVTGIIPEFLKHKEVAKQDIQELIVTRDMHERKHLMCNKSDAFIALPGGIGTLEELVEQLTWIQLGRHSKPVILADFNKFWSPFLDLVDHMNSEGFIREGLQNAYFLVKEVEHIVPKVKCLIDINMKYKQED